ncbi:Signal transduction histidine kinase [Clostridium cavendishii DSM 21758]|uniref:histidine kinase n=1 Tax=Clostridium cavendishii DSM 21758 TaxID=1121302 RepID=A0A1M6EG37_9CLOT|nr:HAMP domain-containing sensor histidine kinase [Clostridium cavendishii]SHI84442.1 Signal transduction histidine kinase [Clostridium cavendishii DSM 21758]
MIKRGFKSLKGKIIFFSLIVITIFLIALNFILADILNKSLENSIKKELESIKAIFVNNINNKLLLEENSEFSYDEVWRYENDIISNFNIYIKFSNNKFKEVRGEELDRQTTEALEKESFGKKVLLNFKMKDSKAIASYIYPVYTGEKYIGSLILQKSYDEEYKKNIDIIKRIIYIELLLFIILIAVLYIFLNKSIKPLERLSKNMEKLAIGVYPEDIIINSNDEIQSLSKSFDFMKKEIERKIDSINTEKEKVYNMQKVTRDFFNNATHEMKTPLAAIIGYSELLKEDDLDYETKKRVLDRVLIESKRMNSLVSNVLDISRNEIKRERDFSNFYINNIIEDIINQMDIRIKEKNISVIKDLKKVICYGVEEEIVKVIINLIDNAIKYTSDSIIRISCYKEKKYVVAKIKNSCGIIPENIKENVFSPFIKYNYNNINISSSGLGLYICKELIESNNGEIGFELIDGSIEFVIKVFNKIN